MVWLLWVMLLPTFFFLSDRIFKFFPWISIFLHVEKVWSPIWCQCIKKTCFSHRSMLICFSWVKSVHCNEPDLEVTQGHIQMHFTHWRPAHNQGKENLTPSHDQKSIKEFADILKPSQMPWRKMAAGRGASARINQWIVKGSWTSRI